MGAAGIGYGHGQAVAVHHQRRNGADVAVLDHHRRQSQLDEAERGIVGDHRRAADAVDLDALLCAGDQRHRLHQLRIRHRFAGGAQGIGGIVAHLAHDVLRTVAGGDALIEQCFALGEAARDGEL